ncbi:MAG: DUF432 domain-containing protein [Candidatus Micrarchaeota archaeon]|nr:DUF432 domain-containing protein [Candidatus Micrarchaeota archaeon]
MLDYIVKTLPGGLKQYIRGDKVIDLPENAAVKEYPVLSGDTDITPYFGMVLESGFAVPPKSRASIYVDLPTDIGVYIVGSKQYKMIDRIEKWPRKFSLYGNAIDGLVYRYSTGKYGKEPSKGKEDAVTTKVEITNSHSNWTVVSKIILEHKYFNFFEVKERVVGETVSMQVVNPKLTIVKLSNRSSLPNGRIMPHVPSNPSHVLELRYGL